MEIKIEKFWLVVFALVIFFGLLLSNGIYEISAYGTGDGGEGYYKINKFTGGVSPPRLINF